MLKIALPKGRLSDKLLPLLKRAGLLPREELFSQRELFFEDPQKRFIYYSVRAQDVGTYVEQGAMDIGIVGYDLIEEHRYAFVHLIDLGIAPCRLVVAGLPGQQELLDHRWVKIATKYEKTAYRYFHARGKNTELVKLYGSVELAPLIGLAPFIVDLVSTGETLKRNGLVIYDTILHSTARLVASRSAYYILHREVWAFADRIQQSLNDHDQCRA